MMDFLVISIDMHQPEIRPNLTLPEKPKRILDRKEKVLRNKTIKYVKVLWNDQTEEAIWELEEQMKQKHPELFEESGKFRDETYFKGGRMK